MTKVESPPIMTGEGRPPAKANPSHSKWTGALMAAGGLLLMLGDTAFLWLSREELTGIGPQAFKTLWHGAGGLALLYIAGGLPLGAILLAAGGARIFPASVRAGRVLWPVLLIGIAYFTYHGVAAFRYTTVPFVPFAMLGLFLLVLFLALVWSWAAKRTNLEPQRQRALDLQLAGGLCFFTAAWEVCGLAGAPGFAAYPELAQKLANQSFILGQASAVQTFIIFGFIFLLLAMRA